MGGSVAQKPSPAFLEGGREMGARIRAHDWAGSPLGAPGQWPTQLKTAVRLMLTTQHPIFIVWGPQHIQLYNDGYSRSFGPERHPAALGQRAHACVEEIWGVIGRQIELVMEGRGATWQENLLIPTTRNGVREAVYWTYSQSPIDDPGSEHGVGGVLVLCSETTRQVLADRANQVGWQRLQQLFEQAPGFMAMPHGPEHAFEMANPAFVELIGHRPLLGKPLLEVRPEALEQGYVDLLDQVYASGKAYSTAGARYEVAGGNGGSPVERFVDFVFRPIPDNAGRVTGTFIQGFDVSGAHSDAHAVRELYASMERRVEAAVAERNLLADVVEFADAFILVIELCDYVLAINEAYATEFERVYDTRSRVGDHLLEMMHGDPKRQARIRTHFDRAINREDLHVAESFDCSDAGRRYYDARFSPLRDRSGTQVGAIATVYDLSDRASEQADAEERARQAQKIEALGQLTGGVAHDFNNLLMVISGGLEVIDSVPASRRGKVMAGMRQAVDRGAGLSKQLLAFSRRQPLQPEVVNLGVTIAGMHEMLERCLRGDARVEVAMEPGLWAVEVDPSELELVVLNLVVNARDAMPDGGTLRIEAHNAPTLNDEELFGDYVKLSLSDTGTGILPDVLARVFEPFFTTREIGKGSGLGLAQAHGFAESSRGAVRLHSEARSGTTVSLYPPRTDKVPALAAAAAGGPCARHADRREGSLLLVEDDNEVAALTGEMLEALGYAVTRVESAEVALGVITGTSASFDLAFSDVMMPGQLDGPDLSQEIRQRRPDLAVVLTTGHVEAVQQKAESRGMPVLPKPYRTAGGAEQARKRGVNSSTA